MDECIGERVNELRLSRLMSQSQLGDVLGLCTSSVSAKLRGKRVWTTRDLVRLSEFFGVSIDFLTRGV